LAHERNDLATIELYDLHGCPSCATVRRALEDLVETFRGDIETRVANADIGTYRRRAARSTDLIVIGTSQARPHLPHRLPAHVRGDPRRGRRRGDRRP
jgi:glutaredoxin